ncbi:MAG: histidinol phosphate phosphatase domain-containing protein [Actinobacteria bacterium]|nr:histidinol phosphate phosphatase domain-containing protein [Actinomycetota bacterium]
MIYDFHTHTFLSDGENSPIELVRFAYAYGYRCIALTDHVSYSNMEEIISALKKDAGLAGKYWDIRVIAGVEITNVPAGSIGGMAKDAREMGAEMVVVHGECITEEVEQGTNNAGLQSGYVDILAHPGLFTAEQARMAVKNDIYIEITSRKGHCLTNGLVAAVGREAGVKFLVNSDAHSASDLFRGEFQEKVAEGAGLSGTEISKIFNENIKDFLKKIGDR